MILLLLFGSAACGESLPDTSPRTPEETIRQYQQFIDDNKFEEAMALSTTRERQRLKDVKTMLSGFPEDSTLLVSHFLRMDCQLGADTTLCVCQIQDQDQLYEVTYRLVREAGKWLIDVPVEDQHMPPLELQDSRLLPDTSSDIQ